MRRPSLSVRCSAAISVSVVAGRQRKGQGGRETQPTRVGEGERGSVPRDLPTARAAHRHRCVLLCEQPEGCRRADAKSDRRRNLSDRNAFVGPLRDEEIEGSAALSLSFFFLSSFPAYGFIRHCRINAGDTLLFRRILLLSPRPANVFVKDSKRRVGLVKHSDRVAPSCKRICVADEKQTETSIVGRSLTRASARGQHLVRR